VLLRVSGREQDEHAECAGSGYGRSGPNGRHSNSRLATTDVPTGSEAVLKPPAGATRSYGLPESPICDLTSRSRCGVVKVQADPAGKGPGHHKGRTTYVAAIAWTGGSLEASQHLGADDCRVQPLKQQQSHPRLAGGSGFRGCQAQVATGTWSSRNSGRRGRGYKSRHPDPGQRFVAILIRTLSAHCAALEPLHRTVAAHRPAETLGRLQADGVQQQPHKLPPVLSSMRHPRRERGVPCPTAIAWWSSSGSGSTATCVSFARPWRRTKEVQCPATRL
jgi:hypothetical protein